MTRPELNLPNSSNEARSSLVRMIEDFGTTPGVSRVVLVSSDGLVMAAAPRDLPREVAERLAALTGQNLSIGRALAAEAGEEAESAGQMIQQFPSGRHYVVGAVTGTAGLGVMVEPGTQLPGVVHEMQRLIAGAGEHLAPQAIAGGAR